MIKVSMYRQPDGYMLQLRLKGHAGYATEGDDIVCSSASILAYTVAQIVKVGYDHGDLEGEPTINMEAGNATIRCVPKPDAYAGILSAFAVAQVGYGLIAHNYPDYVQLKPFGEAIEP